MISNGSRDLEFWKKNKHLIDHICLSFHPEQGDADHFYEVVKLLSEEATVHVNIMMLPEKFEKLNELAQKIASEIADVSIAMQALFENISGKIFAYTPEQKDILDNPKLPWGQNIIHMPKPNKIRKVYRGEMIRTYNDGTSEVVNTPELIARGENNWFGWECHIGVENLVVDYHGNVRRGWCGIGGIIGNIGEDELKIPTKPITCMAKICHCGLDIMATKEVR
jgi:hypothetical protein